MIGDKLVITEYHEEAARLAEEEAAAREAALAAEAEEEAEREEEAGDEEELETGDQPVESEDVALSETGEPGQDEPAVAAELTADRLQPAQVAPIHRRRDATRDGPSLGTGW